MKAKNRDQSLSDSRELDGSYDQLTGDCTKMSQCRKRCKRQLTKVARYFYHFLMGTLTQGNPSTSQSKKTIKQRFLKLLPCCKPEAAPSINSVEDDFELSTVCHRPESMDKLQEQTKFTKKELQVLYRGFKNECPCGVVNEENFKTIYSQFFPQGDSSMYAHFLFEAFDTNKNGSISFEDFVFGLSIILRGTINDRLNWAFNLYDLNKDGCITKEEMLDIMRSIYDMMGKYTYPSMQDDVPREHVESFFQDESIMQSMQLFDNVI
ncbi:hypothetical protein F7725_024066 [Dissostichus mawsoni]|uniref:EF-hand domain-containing protein n=1 Tax=Dissostichus mawsoni TaxID=36200 RepID=A0A7J5XY96_DISMA|nr:hypothetical protein F7725_024066 [Dissostichus mawsoni]